MANWRRVGSLCEDRASGARADAVAVHQQPGGRGRDWPFGVRRDGDEPLVGELEPQTLAALCRILAGHTDPALACFFTLW